MANTSVQREVEAWVRASLSRKHKREFSSYQAPLASGGTFAFDAVSHDRKVVACISTSGYRTASGKGGSGKIHKIRSDMFFLLLARGARHRLAVFTESDMLGFWKTEQDNGRLPKSITLVPALLPEVLDRRLRRARRRSSREVSARP